ncbi:hypothetical protein VNO77_04514 [Canavalia gladiata]|uniref:Uncharacterized protein n=1 Tax=Canavalia gladiata TaxID=3824 RepID=A0AAN9RD98_CANGL
MYPVVVVSMQLPNTNDKCISTLAKGKRKPHSAWLKEVLKWDKQTFPHSTILTHSHYPNPILFLSLSLTHTSLFLSASTNMSWETPSFFS